MNFKEGEIMVNKLVFNQLKGDLYQDLLSPPKREPSSLYSTHIHIGRLGDSVWGRKSSKGRTLLVVEGNKSYRASTSGGCSLSHRTRIWGSSGEGLRLRTSSTKASLGKLHLTSPEADSHMQVPLRSSRMLTESSASYIRTPLNSGRGVASTPPRGGMPSLYTWQNDASNHPQYFLYIYICRRRLLHNNNESEEDSEFMDQKLIQGNNYTIYIEFYMDGRLVEGHKEGLRAQKLQPEMTNPRIQSKKQKLESLISGNKQPIHIHSKQAR